MVIVLAPRGRPLARRSASTSRSAVQSKLLRRDHSLAQRRRDLRQRDPVLVQLLALDQADHHERRQRYRHEAEDQQQRGR
jgi:hypothetical protein